MHGCAASVVSVHWSAGFGHLPPHVGAAPTTGAQNSVGALRQTQSPFASSGRHLSVGSVQSPPHVPVSGFLPQGGGGNCSQAHATLPADVTVLRHACCGSGHVPPQTPDLSGDPSHGAGWQLQPAGPAAHCCPAEHAPLQLLLPLLPQRDRELRRRDADLRRLELRDETAAELIGEELVSRDVRLLAIRDVADVVLTQRLVLRLYTNA
jgi:hypothetical protein